MLFLRFPAVLISLIYASERGRRTSGQKRLRSDSDLLQKAWSVEKSLMICQKKNSESEQPSVAAATYG
jgi:hypothetical protein